MRVSRRRFLNLSGAAVCGGVLGGPGCASPMKGNFALKSGKRVVVVCGGWGGATAAK